MNILSLIEEAFGKRPRPKQVVEDDLAKTELYSDAIAFARFDWRQVTAKILDLHHDAVFGFSSAAFCYFLPGIFSAGIRESRPDLLVNHSLIRTLDRGNSPASWDEFFRARWPTLSRPECLATQKWILWLMEFDPAPIENISLSRAYNTMELLVNQSAATAIARWPR